MACIPATADGVATDYMEICHDHESNNDSLSVPRVKDSKDPLRLPPELPGAQTPELTTPLREKLSAEGYREALEKLYPDLPKSQMPEDAMPAAERGKSSLDALHEMARANHPGLRGAAANVEAARGLMVQAGLPPNPSVGYQADTVRTMNTNGYHGAYLQQTIITASQLDIAAQTAPVHYTKPKAAQCKAWRSNTRCLGLAAS